jgi:hypothetical protein
MNTAQKLDFGYNAAINGNSPEMKIVYRASAVRNIFDANLYETIAEHLVDNDYKDFDKRVGRYQVVVGRDFRFGGYECSCADMEDDKEEVETNFDECDFEAHVERTIERREYRDRVRRETEDNLRWAV